MNIIFYENEFESESLFDEFSTTVVDVLKDVNPTITVFWTDSTTTIEGVSMSDGNKKSSFDILLSYAKKMGYNGII